MNLPERVKYIRTTLGLTMEKFGDRLGVKKQAISKIENGDVNLTDQMALAICREFHVNENWLRTGEGDMRLMQTKIEKLEDFFASLDVQDNFKTRFLLALSSLDESDWSVLEKIATTMAAESQKETAADPQRDRATRHAELDRQMDLEEEAMGESSAS